MTKSIGDKILELRKARSLTQEKLGEQLGLSNQAVSKWENGDSMPDILILPQLCEILGISIDALLEVPQSMRKQGLMKSFRDYSKEVGTANALFQAFGYCASDTDEPHTGYAARITDEAMEMFDAIGGGFVAYGKNYLNLVYDFDIETLAAFFSIFANKQNLIVIKALAHRANLTKAELVEKTGLSISDLNGVLMELVENNICNSGARYSLKEDSNVTMLLTAYYMKSPRSNITSFSHTIINDD